MFFLSDVPITIQGTLLNIFLKIVDEMWNDDQSITNMDVFWMNFIHEQAMLNEF
jgi:hypothetical protein